MGFDCLVCQETAADAVRCSHCSKLFCRAHLMVWVRKSGTCPHCRQRLTVQGVCYMPEVKYEGRNSVDAFIPKVATAEKIQCPFAGCGVTVRVEEMKSHLDICPFGKFLNKVDVDGEAAADGAEENGALGRGRRQSAPASTSTGRSYFVTTTPPIPRPESDDPDVDFHFVRIDDTLSGIAVLYNTNTGHVMRMNNLFSDNIYGRVWLKVPKCPDAEERLKRSQPTAEELETMRRRRALREFMRATGVDEYEAEVYLSHCDHDLRHALENYYEDLAWDLSNQAATENRTLSDFVDDMVYGAARPRCTWECTGCHKKSRTLLEHKTPCMSCGALYCSSCPSRLHAVPRAWLGVTSPAAKMESADVCSQCLPQLKVDYHIYRKMSAVSV